MRVRKGAVTVEAVQYRDEDAVGGVDLVFRRGTRDAHVKTISGIWVEVPVGDWLVTRAKGDSIVVKPDDFAADYVAVEAVP